MDAGLEQTIASMDGAIARAGLDTRDRTAIDALRSALSLRRFTDTTGALARMYELLSTRRDHPYAPKNVAQARQARERAHDVMARARADARRLEPHVDPLVAALAASGDTSTAEEVKSACDAFLASLASLAAAADDVVDVMLVYEAELDPDNAQPPLSLDELEAKLDAAE